MWGVRKITAASIWNECSRFTKSTIQTFHLLLPARTKSVFMLFSFQVLKKQIQTPLRVFLCSEFCSSDCSRLYRHRLTWTEWYRVCQSHTQQLPTLHPWIQTLSDMQTPEQQTTSPGSNTGSWSSYIWQTWFWCFHPRTTLSSICRGHHFPEIFLESPWRIFFTRRSNLQSGTFESNKCVLKTKPQEWANTVTHIWVQENDLGRND